MTGGTDICSLFAGMCSALPVFRGEIQCRLLGMAVETFAQDGTVCGSGLAGELVCLRPFPCQPVGFWPLPGFDSEAAVEVAKHRYQQAYFSEYEGVWCEFWFLSTYLCSSAFLALGSFGSFEVEMRDAVWLGGVACSLNFEL